ncbi:MAG: DUF2232 domain-containing protein [Hyphomicrobiaceae bacterium]
MQTGLPIGLGVGLAGGIASAILFYSAARGSPLLSTTLFVLTPLPSMIAGLGWGWLSALAGALAGAAATAVATDARLGFGYLLAVGLPIVLVAYLAYLSRPWPGDPNRREWYPAGRLVAALSLIGAALPVAAAPALEGGYESLRAPMSAMLLQMSERTAAEFGGRQMSAEQAGAIADILISVLPAALAAYWLAIMSINVYLGARIARASGRLSRDWPDLPRLELPLGVFPLLALAVVATFTSGLLYVAGASLCGALFVAFMLVGLSVVHSIARNRGRGLIWATYGLLAVGGPYIAAALSVLGFIEPFINLRRRFGTPPPPSLT